MRNDLKIGSDQDTINSEFVEIDKNTTNTKRNIIVGCIYRPLWVKIPHFHTELTDKLGKLKSENYSRKIRNNDKGTGRNRRHKNSHYSEYIYYSSGNGIKSKGLHNCNE